LALINFIINRVLIPQRLELKLLLITVHSRFLFTEILLRFNFGALVVVVAMLAVLLDLIQTADRAEPHQYPFRVTI